MIESIIPTISFVLTFLFLADFIRNLGKNIPIRELILVTLSIQCLFVPALYYNNLLNIPEIYAMAVPEATYFNYMVPAFLLFATGISIGKKKSFVIDIKNKDDLFKIGKTLIILGIVADLALPFIPAVIRFFVLLIGYFKYIGAIYVLFSHNRKYVIWVILAFANTLVYSLAQAMFQNLLGWSMFFILYYFYKQKTPVIRQVSIISLLLTGIFILQHVKGGYRLAIQDQKVNANVEEKVNMFVDQYIESTTDEETFSEESLNNNFVRFNQGYIISRIMNHVPSSEPFAKGETIQDALYSSVVPRFLDPGKTRVGGSSGLYTRFTGYELIGGTSKDLSIFGEIYANFGVKRGIFSALIVGLFYNLFISALIYIAQRDPQLIFWIPYLFLIMVRPENAFVAVLNHFTKASLILYITYHLFLKKYMVNAQLKTQSHTPFENKIV